jgi:hypothetical protein
MSNNLISRLPRINRNSVGIARKLATAAAQPNRNPDIRYTKVRNEEFIRKF